MNKASLLSTTLLIGTTAFVSAGDLTGKVTLKGTPPKEIEIRMDETCGKLHDTAATTRHYVVGADGGLANVFVYVKSGVDKKFDAPATESVMDQVGCMYEPYISGVQAGQNLRIKNSDPVLHNVHATPSPSSGNKEFNLGQPQGAADIVRSFPNPEVLVRFKCDVHPWMFAYVGVLNHPYHAVTDKDGNFTIKGLPDGKYTVVAFHEKTHRGGEGVSQEVTVSGNTKADFVVALPGN